MCVLRRLAELRACGKGAKCLIMQSNSPFDSLREVLMEVAKIGLCSYR